MKKVLLVSTAVGLGVWLLVQKRSRGPFSLGWSTRQKLRGTVGQVKGNAQQAVGRITGDPMLVAEGMVHEALGAVHRGVGEVAAKARNVAFY